MATDQQIFIVKGLYNEWMKNCLDLIENSYGLNFQSESTSAHEITLNFADSNTMSNIANAGYHYLESDGKAFDLTLNINVDEVANIDTTDASGNLEDKVSPFDVTIAHELIHSVMEANIAYFSELPGYFVEGSADLTGGGDGSYSNIRLLLENGAYVLKGVYAGYYDSSYDYAAGFMLLRYLVKQTADNSGKNPVQVMKDLMSYLVANGGKQESYDAAINSASNGLFANESALIESFTNAVANATITTDDEADAFIKSVANVDLGGWVKTDEQTITEGNTTRTTWTNVWDFGDSGAITGSDAGGGSYKNYTDIVPESSAPSSWNLPSTSYTYKGLTMIFPDEFLVAENSAPTNYTYSGGDMVISDYQGAHINLASDFAGIGLDENNFYVNSSSGTLTIQNARGKLISYGDAAGNLIAYSYMANSGGEIDGRGISQAEIIIGANNADNQIFAGSGGSSIWGGVGGEDTLTGGDGYDEFFYAIGSGNDTFQNAADNDLINLLGVSLSQISYANIEDGEVNIGFVSGENLRVVGNSNVSYKLGNEVFACDNSNRTWYYAKT